MTREPDGCVWVVRTNTDGQRIFREKRDAEEAAFHLVLKKSVDGDVTINDDPNRSLTYFEFEPQLGESGWVVVEEEPLY